MHETLQMDQYFEYFLEKMGPAIERRHVPPSSIEHYRGKLPDQLLAYWEEHGWCGYADGLFWTVDPQEFEPVLGAVLGNTAFAKQDTYYLIARGAFGELYFWGEKTGHSLSVFAPGSFCMPRASRFTGEKMNFGAQAFFAAISRKENDFEGMFEPAMKKLGRLGPDEMYGFVPALGLGGLPR
jgi:hypothetical protein